MKPTITIVGASGFIGSSIYGFFRECLADEFLVKGTYFRNRLRQELECLDATDRGQLQGYLLEHRPDYLMLLCGCKDVERCQRDVSFAFRRNTRPTEHAVEIIKHYALPTRVILFSTDYVFDGERGGYEPQDLPQPRTQYGRSNAAAEETLKSSPIDFKILRTSAVMGKGARFLDWLVARLLKGERVEAYEDVQFTPTPLSLVREITPLVMSHFETTESILHLVGESHLSRYDFARMVARILGTGTESVIPAAAPPLFQKRLTLVQSDFVASHQTASLETRLSKELDYARENPQVLHPS